MRTEVEIPDQIWEDAQEEARRRGLSIDHLIADSLSEAVGLASRITIKSKRRPKLSPAAAKWLKEWLALGEKASRSVKGPVSSAEMISKMRR